MTTTASLSPAAANAQSLASGTIGMALLAVERAASGSGDWSTARRLVRQAASGPVDAGLHTGLYYGAPAVAFLLKASECNDRFATARQTLDRHVRRITRQRLNAAQERIRRGESTRFAEYDVFYGLTGIGALLMQHQPDSEELGDTLQYVVRLAEPRIDEGLRVPGWWVAHDPDPTMRTPGGHANCGMAHGAAGLLALLALGIRHGYVVDGQLDAVERLSSWFEHWRQDSADGAWWPQWVTRDNLRAGRPAGASPGRPSWCYGAVGVARALQLAAMATRAPARQEAAESTLAACLSSPRLDCLPDTGLCHGLAGLYQTAFRAASDARHPQLAERLHAVARTLARRTPVNRTGFLTGRTGFDLVMQTVRTSAPPKTRWDTCLLIT
jgi:hypothetical protein